MRRRRISTADTVIYAIMILLCIFTLYPFLYTISYSFSDGHAVLSNPVKLLPVSPELLQQHQMENPGGDKHEAPTLPALEPGQGGGVTDQLFDKGIRQQNPQYAGHQVGANHPDRPGPGGSPLVHLAHQLPTIRLYFPSSPVCRSTGCALP